MIWDFTASKLRRVCLTSWLLIFCLANAVPSVAVAAQAYDLSGAWRAIWEAKGLNRAGYRITQDTTGNLTFVAPDGTRSGGRFVAGDTVEASEWKVRGRISSDGNTIQWDNGSRWVREGGPPTPSEPPSPKKSLTGAWVHSANGLTQTPDSKVIILQEGNTVTLIQSYKMEINRNQWQTLRCVGPLKGNDLQMQCQWVQGGNPMGYANSSTLVLKLTADGDHLNGYTVKNGEHGQAFYYSRVP